MSIFGCDYSLEEWQSFGRSKVLSLFEENVYGIRPQGTVDASINFFTVCDECKDGMRKRAVLMKIDGIVAKFEFYSPTDDIKRPAFLYIMHPAQYEMYFNDNENSAVPLKFLLENGFCVAVLFAGDIVKDNIKEKSGIFCQNRFERTGNKSWGVISAWAWGASKVLDFLVLQTCVDPYAVIVAGHSRGGKTALWTAATDERFYGAISNCSGCGGAALSRGNTGETIDSINRSFPFWFAEKYREFANNENSLPIDQHMLLGLIAPRKCFISSATKDDWADPNGEFLSAVFASRYYELYGKKGLISDAVPIAGELYGEGNIAYWRNIDEHKISKINWMRYVEFFKKELL